MFRNSDTFQTTLPVSLGVILPDLSNTVAIRYGNRLDYF
jgi:hypothetical protein